VRVLRDAARIASRPDGSNFSRLTTLEFSQSFGREFVEATFRRVTFDLPIPSLPVVLDEPVAERRELFGAQLFNFALEGFNLRHVIRKCTLHAAYSTAPFFPPRGVELDWHWSEAMPLVGSRNFATKVVGESFYDNNLHELCGPAEDPMRQFAKTAILTLENDNPYDRNSVRVDMDGLTVGHLSRNDARRFRAACAGRNPNHFECAALLISLRGHAASDYGVRLDLYI
jgi:hypothetical protein